MNGVSNPMRLLPSAVCALSLLLLAACASSSPYGREEGEATRLYDAQTVTYQSNPSPVVMSRKFISRQTVSRRGGIESYRFENFFGAVGDHPDTTVIIALSGNSAGFGVYDAAGRALLEIPKGSYNGATMTFVRQLEKGKQVVRWTLGNDALSSVVESSDASGRVFESEITTYFRR